MIFSKFGQLFRHVTAGAVLLAFSGVGLGVQAEPLDYYLVEGVTYDQTVLKPAEVFGHDIGDQPIRHDLMVSYIQQLADASPRMQAEVIGYSHEKRPILFIVVSDPDNLARLDEIKANHLLRTDPARASEASDDLPVITWVNYGVHGAEASGMDAAVPTLYHLAAAQDEATRNQLKNSVILVTAIFNPDGHARRAAWVTQYGSDVRSSNPDHDIHTQGWPGGRTNHYWFDLNRQWLLQTQPESQAWLGKWHEWRPEVSADFHEMGGESTYYFHPGVPTRKHPLIPGRGRDLLVEIAGYHQRYMDGARELYFTEEGFDNYYVGKGSTYPQINGSLGILFEAGAQMGIQRESAQGLKTYARNIRTHFRTSLTTIEGAAAMRTKLHAYQRDFYREAASLARADDVKAYVFRAPEDPVRLNMFLDLLARHRVQANRLSGEIKVGDKTYGEDSYIVALDQPQYRMAKAIFGRITEFPDKVFYDVSGWTLPLAYGIDHSAVAASVRGRVGDVASAAFAAAPVPDVAPYAYVFEWSHYYAPRALNRILEAGILVRVVKEPVQLATTRGVVPLPRGSIVVPLDRQRVDAQTIHQLMEAAARDGVPVHAATSGHTLNAGADLGSRDSISDLTAPRILLVTGRGASPYDAGEVWHVLDHRMKIPVTLVNRDRLPNITLSDYSHIILVGGAQAAISDAMLDPLKTWIRTGGSLIATRQAAAWAAGTIAGYKDTDGETQKPVRLSYDGKGQNDAEHVIGGALFESNLDITHPLGFGIARPLVATNRNVTFTLPVPRDPYGQVAVYTDAPLLSGYASDRRIREIRGTPMLTAERFGRGSLILFADNPNFRATYLGSEKLFLNAIFFSTAFDRARFGEDVEEEAHAE